MGKSSVKLLFVGAGPAQATGIETAARLGCEVVAIDGNPDAPGLKLANRGVVLDVKDVRGATALARSEKVDGVLSVASEVSLPTVAAVNQALGLPGLTPEQVVLATDKGAMRLRHQACGIKVPPFFIFSERSQLKTAAATTGFPAVLKPVDSSGSRGVHYVANFEELALAFDAAASHSGAGRVILEQFMPGTEISVEAFVAHGEIHILTLSDKIRTKPPYLLDTEVTFPSAHPADTRRRIVDLALASIEALGLDNCPIHMEQMVTPDGPMLVEMAARGPGFKVYTDIIPFVTGVNGVEAQLRLMLGETPALTPYPTLKGACVRFWGGQDGVVKSVEGVEAAKRLPGVYDMEIYAKPGDHTRALTSGPDRIGHIIALAASRAEALATVDQAFAMVKINY